MTMIELNQPQTGTHPAFTRPKNAPPAFHLLAKPTGTICNLDCKYCFVLNIEEEVSSQWVGSPNLLNYTGWVFP